MEGPQKGFPGSAPPRHPQRCARTQPPSPCAVHGRTASQSTPWCQASSAPTLTRRGRGAADRQATEECFAARAMMGCVGEPQDVANAVVFLASPQSGWITAQTSTVDGGRTDGRPLRTVLIAPSLRLAHSPLEDGRKRPEERSTQPKYFYACSPSSIAASTFGGDIGSSVSRRPVARSIALAMAAIGGQILTSAAPLAPHGGFGFGTSPTPRPSI